MTVPESAVERDEFCGQTVAEDSLMVAFRHKTGDLMVRNLLLGARVYAGLGWHINE